jgi:VanZ family protein
VELGPPGFGMDELRESPIPPAFQKPFACLRTTLLPWPMSKTRSFVQYWLPVLLWMALIFSASSDRLSFQHSSRIIAPFIHWLISGASEETVHCIVVLVRKAAHLTEYAVLALLVLRPMARPSVNSAWTWRWSDAIRTLLVVMLYAASDEFHQSFVPSRQASIWDVLIDTTGGFFGLLLVWVLGRWRKRW